MDPSPYLPEDTLYHTVPISERRHSITPLIAITSSPVHLSYMCKISSSDLEFSLGLEPIILSPYRSTYDAGPNLKDSQNFERSAIGVKYLWCLSMSLLSAFFQQGFVLGDHELQLADKLVGCLRRSN